MVRILRASTIGFPCDRHLWYATEGHEPLQDTRTLRIFDVGTALEPVVIEWLREEGWEIVFYNKGSQEAPVEHVIEVIGGEIHGHFDALVFRPGVGNVLVDIKTMNERAFTNWKRQGTEEKSPQYLDQLHVYGGAAIAAGLPLDKLGIVAVNKNNSDMRIELLDYSIERMLEIRGRAERIFASKTPPEPGSRLAGWSCRYCSYRHICNIPGKEADTTVEEGIAATTDGDIINAMEILREARDLEKDAKELSDQAKEILEKKVKNQGIKSIHGGSLVLTLSEIISARFDSATFKKIHPDLARTFTRESRSVKYDIREAI